jgi:hypothetical protein
VGDVLERLSVAGRVAVVLATVAVLAGVPARTEGWQALWLLAGFAGLGAVLAVERRARVLTPRGVLVPAAVLLAVAVVAPPIGSRDVWSYVMYGRIAALHHADPYRIAPSAFPHDPLLSRVSPVWRDTRSVYGPVFTWLSALGMRVVGNSALLARAFFQLLAAGAAAVAMWVLWRETHEAAAMAIVGLNPLVLVAVVNGGHSDALVGLGVLAGVALVVHRRPWLGGVVLGLAALVKIVALLPLAAVAGWLLLRRERRGSVRVAATVVAAGLLTVGAGYALAGGRTAIVPLSEARLHYSDASPWDEVRVVLTRHEIHEGERARTAGLEVRRGIALGVDLAVLALGVAFVLWRRRDTSPALVAGGAGLAYMLLGGYVLPWYVAWGAFVMALQWRERLTWLLLAQGALLELAYLPNPRTGGTILPHPVHDVAERAELALRHTALPVLSAAAALTVIMAVCFASSRSTSGTLTVRGPSDATRSSPGSTG